MNYYHNDLLHSTTVLTDESGDVVEETKYDPWGKVLSGGTASKFLYTGQEHDGETGLNYYNARYYSPDLMHFTQPDDVVQNIYDPQLLNRYSYVRNNPLTYTDPSGHFISTILGIINAFNAVKTAVTNSKTATPPTSAAKVTTINGQIVAQNNSNSNSGNGVSNNGSSKQNFNPTKLLPSKGAIDINYSTSFVGPIGGAGGVKLNRQGIMLYNSISFMVPGKSLSVTRDPNQPEPFADSINGSFTLPNHVNVNAEYPINNSPLSGRNAPIPLTLPNFSFGLGFPDKDASININHNYSFHNWGDGFNYKFIQTVE